MMKKVATTLTALVFALGLALPGYAQTTVKEGNKPEVKPQTPVAAPQVTPVEKDKSKEALQPLAKEDDKTKGKGEQPEKKVSKKEKDKKPSTPVTGAKKEEKKESKQ